MVEAEAIKVEAEEEAIQKLALPHPWATQNITYACFSKHVNSQKRKNSAVVLYYRVASRAGLFALGSCSGRVRV